MEEAVQKRLEGTFGVQPTGHIEDAHSSFFASLTPQDREYRTQIVVHLEHIIAAGLKSKDAVQQLVREVAFTHLNRLCAFKMMEERELLEIGGGRSRSAVSQALKSQGFIFYLALIIPMTKTFGVAGNRTLPIVIFSCGWQHLCG